MRMFLKVLLFGLVWGAMWGAAGYHHGIHVRGDGYVAYGWDAFLRVGALGVAMILIVSALAALAIWLIESE